MEHNTAEEGPVLSQNAVAYALGSLYGRIQQLSDPRKAKGKRYSLVTLMVVIFLAKLSGQDKPCEIADWARNRAEMIVQLLNLRQAWMPHHNTIRRVFQSMVSEAELGQLLQDYHQQQPVGELLAMDGKALKCARPTDQDRCEYALSVCDVENNRVLAQEIVELKENEIVAAPKLLAQIDLKGKIITADAIHTQRSLSAYIVEHGGNYLWPVKENQPQLYHDIKQLFAPQRPIPGFGKISTDFQSTQHSQRGHGRLEIRTLQSSEMLMDFLDWPGLRQVYQLERKFHWLRQGQIYKTSCEVEYGITSLPRSEASAERILMIRRRHWLIETGLHYRRDVTFHEDATRMTIGPAGRILSLVHDLILGLLRTAGFTNAAQGRRWFDGHLQQALALLTGIDVHYS